MDYIYEQFEKKRRYYFVASMLICVCAGFGYAWSVLQNPIIQFYNWSDSKVSLTFTITIIFSTMSPLFLNNIIKRLSIRQVMLIGGVVYGIGIFATSLISSVWMLYLFYGVIAGLGCGLIYPQMMSYAIMLFPDKQGLASGLMAAAYGSGAIIWAPVAVKLITRMSLQTTFRILGLLFCFVIVMLGNILKDVPEGFLENKEDTNNQANLSFKNYSRNEMVKTPIFYLMVINFTFGLSSGLMIIGQASPILQDNLNFSVEKAAIIVGVFSACNTFGRFIWGKLLDKIGMYTSMNSLFIIACLSMLILIFTNISPLVISAMGLTASCYGGFATIITPLTAEIFGNKYITENYGIMYSVFGLASLIGPKLAIEFKNISGGSYRGAFIAAALFSAFGIVLTSLIYRIAKK